MTQARRAGALIVGLLLAGPSAYGGGFYITDIGTRSMARAGAFVAAPDSVLAAHYNPAGLSLLKGFHTELSGSLVAFDATFQRTCPCTDPATEGAAAFDAALEAQFAGHPGHTSTPIAIPFLGFAYGFDWLDTTVALAGYGPNSGRHKWGELPATKSPTYETTALTFPERYRAQDVNNLEANINLSVAFSPWPGVRLGGSALVYATGSRQGLTLWTNYGTFNDAPEDPRFDVPIVFQLNNTWALNWGVGGSWEIVKGLSLGSSFRGKRSVRGKGKLVTQLPRFLIDTTTGQPLQGASITGEEAQIELNVAPIWRTGLQYSLPGVFTAELALVYEGWSNHERILIRPQGVSIDLQGETFEIPTLIIDRRWQDTWSIRLGGELNLWQPWLGLRAGYFYETASITEERVEVGRIDRPKHGVSLGLATTYKGVTLEVSGMYIHLLSLTTRDSKVKQTTPFDPSTPDSPGSNEFVTTVGNGTINAHYFIGSVSLSFAFDAVSTPSGGLRAPTSTFDL